MSRVRDQVCRSRIRTAVSIVRSEEERPKRRREATRAVAIVRGVEPTQRFKQSWWRPIHRSKDATIHNDDSPEGALAPATFRRAGKSSACA